MLSLVLHILYTSMVGAGGCSRQGHDQPEWHQRRRISSLWHRSVVVQSLGYYHTVALQKLQKLQIINITRMLDSVVLMVLDCQWRGCGLKTPLKILLSLFFSYSVNARLKEVTKGLLFNASLRIQSLTTAYGNKGRCRHTEMCLAY